MSNAPESENKQAEPEHEIHISDYVYDEIGPSFTPAIIVRKEAEQLMRKPRVRHRL